MVNPTIFREYDIRGLEATELADEVVELLGKAYATYMLAQSFLRVAIGRDVRLSSPRIAGTLAKTLVNAGLQVTDLGVVPTPVFYFSLRHLDQDGGIMVTGSHNPIEYNGMKICRGFDSIYGEEIQQLRAVVEAGGFALKDPGQGGLTHHDPVPAYVALLEDKIGRSSRPLKLVVDAGNGTAGPIAPRILSELGHHVVPLYCDPDGRFPHHLPDPTLPEHMQDLIARVRSEKADLGIGFDGDADRIGAVDDSGQIVWGDQLLALYAREILSLKQNQKIVFEVKCSQSLIDDIVSHGGIPVMSKTGHSLIEAKMKQEGAPLAGEMSGHIYFADEYFGFDDAIYASLRLARLLSRAEKTLAELVGDLPKYFATPEIRVGCPDEAKFKIVDNLKAYFQRDYEVVDVDGARVVFDGGWGLVRASNTEPVLVLRFEGKTPERRDTIKAEFLSVLRTYPEISLVE